MRGWTRWFWQSLLLILNFWIIRIINCLYIEEYSTKNTSPWSQSYWWWNQTIRIYLLSTTRPMWGYVLKIQFYTSKIDYDLGLISTTVKDNICFGMTFDQEKFDNIVGNVVLTEVSSITWITFETNSLENTRIFEVSQMVFIPTLVMQVLHFRV